MGNGSLKHISLIHTQAHPPAHALVEQHHRPLQVGMGNGSLKHISLIHTQAHPPAHALVEQHHRPLQVGMGNGSLKHISLIHTQAHPPAHALVEQHHGPLQGPRLFILGRQLPHLGGERGLRGAIRGGQSGGRTRAMPSR